MISDPEEHNIIPILPGFTTSLGEEDPGIGSGTIIQHDAVQMILRSGGGVVFLPYGGFKPLATGITNCNIGEEIVIIISN